MLIKQELFYFIQTMDPLFTHQPIIVLFLIIDLNSNMFKPN